MYSLDKFHEKSKEDIIRVLNQVKANYDSLKKDCNKLQDEKSDIKKELAKREKELTVIYKLGSLIESQNNTLLLPEILAKIVTIIPSGWQYPEITCAKITLGKDEYKTENFKTSQWRQSETVFIDNQPEGTIEVFYLEQKPDEFEGLFKRRVEFVKSNCREIG